LLGTIDKSLGKKARKGCYTRRHDGSGRAGEAKKQSRFRKQYGQHLGGGRREGKAVRGWKERMQQQARKEQSIREASERLERRE
jgi:hypothetical protein